MLETYDELIEKVRKEDVPLNRTSLATLAVKRLLEEFTNPNGSVNVKGIAELIKKNKLDLDIEKTEAKLKKMKKERGK